MKEWIVQLVHGFPPELATVLLAAIPVTELRASIPIAVTSFGLSPAAAFVFSVLGNLIPIAIVYTLLPPLVDWAARKSPWLKRILDHYFRHLEHTHRARFEKYGTLALVLFTAIPLPGTGAWTGTILAVLFGIRPSYGATAIAAGVLAAGVIVLLITQGTLSVLSFLV